MDFEAGEILYVKKPLHWTSFDVVNRIRRVLCRQLDKKKLKVGHAGTLDPLASGVMIVCTGKATKQIESLQEGVKEYIATLELGATTPSFDLEHPIDERYPTAHITRDLVDEKLAAFRGEIWQVPPIYSAVKVDGKRAFDYARKGKEVELKPKLLVIDELEVLRFELPVLQLRVVCSKGTYIRALARDIGIALGSGAHLTVLDRTRVGNVTLEQCWEIEDLLEKIKQIT
ncbi:MAG TPA: tRNA pseudouridine(55) synthase TruB [Paludibacteraceae bacterium]|nr:tRNA pseudouridine(55) synthase TruB [Paludibacteraceae bacterium]HQB68494.1 tRNA pseudouridine(55) synthase TruB [Paludibacteraceae bacterium]HRS66995.1 tRNA pseudouridine(55) synthase TruB [Paludibacteraceae bacterium]